MKIILAPEARDDLAEIGGWIERDNPRRAATFVDELQRACAGLARQPLRFPIVRSVGGHPIRKRLHRGYIILYRVHSIEVEVVRIVHGKRDWVAMLEGPPAAT